MNKGGISAVVANVLIVLLVVSAVSIVWIFILPLIIQSGDEVGTEQFFVNLQIEKFELSPGEFEITIRRGAGKGEVSFLKVIVFDGTETNILETSEGLNELEIKTFIFSNLGLIKKISVAPVFESSSGDEKLGNVGAKLEFSNKEVMKNHGAVAWWRLEGNARDEIGDNDGTLVGSGELVRNGDAETGDLTNFDEFSGIYSDGHEGDFSFYQNGVYYVKSEDFISIDLTKTYELSGWFKKTGTGESRLLFGYVPFDESKVQINNENVHAMPDTETILYESVSSSDTSVKVVDASNWANADGEMIYHSHIAFEIDDSGNYDDLPNRKITNRLGVGTPRCYPTATDMGDYWEIFLCSGRTMGVDYPVGTKVRHHISGGTYMYTAGLGNSDYTLTNTWNDFSSSTLGENLYGVDIGKFWKGTRYVRILLNTNYLGDSSSQALSDDISLTTTPITYTGPTSADGKLGEAYDFDGVDDHISIIDSSDFDVGPQGFTYSAWINADNLDESLNMFMGSNLPYFNIKSSGKLDLSVRGGGSQKHVYGDTILNIGNWYHVVGTHNSDGTAKIYVNGVLDGSASLGSPGESSTSHAQYIGKWHSHDSSHSQYYPFTGTIDEVMIFDRALTAEEIQALYNLDYS